MSFHVHTTKDDNTGKTEIVSVDFGPVSVIFERKGECIHVTTLVTKRQALEAHPEEITLTPGESRAFVEGIIRLWFR